MIMDIDSLKLLSFSVPSTKEIYGFASEAAGSFSLYDAKACDQPRINHPCPEGCSREVLKIEATGPVTVVAFDEWQQENTDSTCDYLVFDSGENKRVFAFCELTCSVEEYVESNENKSGKRAKAYSQMVATWELISESDNPVFQANVMRYVSKIGIFGWRDRKNGNNTGAMRSPRAFTRTPSSKAGISRYSNFVFGENFDFIQVKYPHVFHWA